MESVEREKKIFIFTGRKNIDPLIPYLWTEK
jgi:hypothetical protein